MDKKMTILAVAVCCVSIGHAANINFADGQVKTLCVQNWDSNGDGELSEAEAAAVTTLGSVFRAKKNITSFEELRFFTGLTAIDDKAFYQSSIQKVAFPPTVTEIGDQAFKETDISGELRIPGTVKTIKDRAFDGCKSVTAVILEEGVQTVGWESFTGPFTTLSLPSSLTYMSSMTVNPFENAYPGSGVFVPKGDLYVYVHSATPPAINKYAFYYVFRYGHLIVPFGTVDAYKAAEAWAQFGEYLEYGDVNMDGDIDVKDVVAVSAHIMEKNPSPFNRLCADTNGDGEIDVKDVVGISGYIMQR